MLLSSKAPTGYLQKLFEKKGNVKTIKKKLIAILLVLALAVCALPISAFADWEPNYPVDRNNDGNWIIRVRGVVYNVDYNTVLRQGNTTYSRDVYVAQIALNRINSLYSTANCGAGGADGYFGNNTYTGVKAFQTFWNNTKGSSLYYMIGVDGVIGNCTWACISYYST